MYFLGDTIILLSLKQYLKSNSESFTAKQNSGARVKWKDLCFYFCVTTQPAPPKTTLCTNL